MNGTRKALVAVTVVGLAIDAYVHLKVAGGYDGVKATVSQGQLFRVEAGAAIVAAILLLVRPNRITAAIAAAVAGGGTVALLLYYFVDVGQLGPMPNMYEPVLYAEKTLTLMAQTVAALTGLALVFLGFPKAKGSADH